MNKNILILQHIPIKTPGYILDLGKGKCNLTTIELDRVKNSFNLSFYDAMFCMETIWILGWKMNIHGL